MSLEESLDWVYNLQVHGIKLGLDNMMELMKRLGNPQNELKTIHVAGSDGKGSTTNFLSSMLIADGYSVGLYTSPHLISFNERISINRKDISDEELAQYVEKVRRTVEEMAECGYQCTFFEVTTAIAFLYFRDKGTDYAVIEVGMGGRFDATNIITPEVSVISNISLEHTKFLGNTIQEIAFEKAGIIKPGVPAVTINNDDVFQVISEVADSSDSKLIRVDPYDIVIENNGVEGLLFSYKGRQHQLSICGLYQARNASLAMEALNILGVGNQDGLKDSKPPCRMEKLENLPMVLDVTHTSMGSKNLADNISEIYGKVSLVFGVLDDKDIDGICHELSRIADRVIITHPESERATDTSIVGKIMEKYTSEVTVVDDINSAMDSAMSNLKEGETILVTGSFYMAGDVMKWLKKTSV